MHLMLAYVKILVSVDAYVACGGKANKTGYVHRDTLVKIIKYDFGLQIDIEVGAGVTCRYL